MRPRSRCWCPRASSSRRSGAALPAQRAAFCGTRLTGRPPLHSGVDVSPIVWVALISFTNEILLGKQGLLVLLSQKVA